MLPEVGIRELRQNLSKHLERVKAGETLEVTERGRIVARLSPSGPAVPEPYAELAARFGATIPTGDLVEAGRRHLAAPGRRWPDGTADAILAEGREDRMG